MVKFLKIVFLLVPLVIIGFFVSLSVKDEKTTSISGGILGVSNVYADALPAQGAESAEGAGQGCEAAQGASEGCSR